MNKLLWESDNGKWKIGIVDWRSTSRRFAISDSIFIQYPTIYDNGKIGFDNPTLLPKYVKEKANELLSNNKELLEEV